MADLANFKQSIEEHKERLLSLDEPEKTCSENRLSRADTVLDYLQAYTVIINELSPSATIMELFDNTKIIAMVLPVIQISQTLLEANDVDTINVASAALLLHAQTHLMPHPTLGAQIAGGIAIVAGLLVSAIFLASATLLLCAVILGPPMGIAAAVCTGILVDMLALMGLFSGVVICSAGVRTFMDSDDNRDALYSKVIDFNGVFFNNRIPEPLVFANEAERTSSQIGNPL